MRYELFNRLNTGGFTINDQESGRIAFFGQVMICQHEIPRLASNDCSWKLVAPSDRKRQDYI